MGYAILRNPRRRFATRYSVGPMLASVRAEIDATHDIVAEMKMKCEARVREAYRARRTL